MVSTSRQVVIGFLCVILLIYFHRTQCCIVTGIRLNLQQVFHSEITYWFCTDHFNDFWRPFGYSHVVSNYSLFITYQILFCYRKKIYFLCFINSKVFAEYITILRYKTLQVVLTFLIYLIMIQYNVNTPSTKSPHHKRKDETLFVLYSSM